MATRAAKAMNIADRQHLRSHGAVESFAPVGWLISDIAIVLDLPYSQVVSHSKMPWTIESLLPVVGLCVPGSISGLNGERPQQ